MSTSKQTIKSTLERILFETDVSYKGMGQETCCDRSCDLSIGGIYLQAKQILSVNETLFLDFTVPTKNGDYGVVCKAKVAWTNYEENRCKIDYPPGAGLEFMTLPQENLSILEAYIDEYDENKKMNMICAWCGKHIGMRKGPYGKTSHGICAECKKIYL